MKKILIGLTLLTSLYSQDKLAPYQPHTPEEFPFENYEICSVPLQGSFYVDIDRDWIKGRLKKGETWEKHTLEIIQKYTFAGATVLDIGAHIGLHTVTLSRCVGEGGRVIAFEPQKKIYQELCQNLSLNSCYNVTPLCVALGEKEGFAYLGEIDPANEGGRYISNRHFVEKIPLVSLDELELEHISFIKMDAENYEEEILKGGYKTLMRDRPILYIEIGGGILKQAEEKTSARKHLKRVLLMLDKVFNYEVSLVYGRDYLALPRP